MFESCRGPSSNTIMSGKRKRENDRFCVGQLGNLNPTSELPVWWLMLYYMSLWRAFYLFIIQSKCRKLLFCMYTQWRKLVSWRIWIFRGRNLQIDTYILRFYFYYQELHIRWIVLMHHDINNKLLNFDLGSEKLYIFQISQLEDDAVHAFFRCVHLTRNWGRCRNLDTKWYYQKMNKIYLTKTKSERQRLKSGNHIINLVLERKKLHKGIHFFSPNNR